MAKKQSKLSIKVLGVLQSNTDKPMKPETISQVLDMNQRSVRYALNILYDHQLVDKIPDMEDLRTNFYTIKRGMTQDLLKEAIAQI
jgi:DNA-binding transcriptional ArsR family regulator